MYVLANLKPHSVFHYFELLSSVPHGSGNTKRISDLVVQTVLSFPFAASDPSSIYQDSYNNIIIKKPASPGFEKSPAVIIQGHLDMVCAKSPDSPLDMSKDPIVLKTDGDTVYAEGTSLGGDDLIAAAIALAVLEDDSIVHPPLEIVLTVDEEVGMLGAAALDCTSLKGKMLLNLDSESFGVLTAGCAGGVRAHGFMPVTYEATADNSLVYRITVQGLLGGHSGEEINEERGNANILLARILYSLRKLFPLRLGDFHGGAFDNVICPSSEAVVTFSSDYSDTFIAALTKVADEIHEELSSSDPGFTVSFSKETTSSVLSLDSSDNVLKLLNELPNGVQAMNHAVPGAVQTSLNLGKTKLDKKYFSLDTLIRSSVNTQKEYLLDKVTLLIQMFGGTVETTGDYPAWQYKPKSVLRDILQECFLEITGKEAEVEVIHAGVECGLLAYKIPGLDAVSLGPDLSDIHSPNERMNVESVRKTWSLVCSFLKKAAMRG